MRVRILFWHSGESFGRKSSLNLTVKKSETLFIHSFTWIAKTLSLDHYMILEIISSPLSVNCARLCLDLLRINERAHRMRCRGHSLRIKDFNGEQKKLDDAAKTSFPFSALLIFSMPDLRIWLQKIFDTFPTVSIEDLQVLHCWPPCSPPIYPTL